MKISVVGTGYVGLVAGACFADSGHTVICVDKDAKKIEALRRGEIPIYEPGLEEIVKRAVQQGRLHFTTSMADAVQGSEVIFMAVGTPASETGEPDLRFLKEASEQVGRAMPGYRLIVNKSTVPVGAHRSVAQWISSVTDQPCDVISNPEFLKEGSAVEDFLKPDRVVIGTESESAYKKMAELYEPFVRQGNPVLWMDPISAELTKYACNAFLATRISFMNELSRLCDAVGGDIELIRKGMTTDVRIGKHFLYAGAGYGGSCFPKDVQALVATGRKNNVKLEIIEAAENANARQKHRLAELAKEHFGGAGALKGKVFAVWGLAFKPNTDDMREAPALTLIDTLIKHGAKVRAFDPVATENARPLLDASVEYPESSYGALEGADGLLLVTEWNEFRQPDWTRVKSLMRTPVVFDGRNIYSNQNLPAKGFKYYGIGLRRS